MFAQTVRETTEKVPGIAGDYDGTTRAGTLGALLAKHQEPKPPEPEQTTIAQRIKAILAARRMEG